jgi:tRNA-binding protein
VVECADHELRAGSFARTLVVCVCNLGAKNIAGFTSELLILGARDADGKVIVLGPRSAVAIGEPIF